MDIVVRFWTLKGAAWRGVFPNLTGKIRRYKLENIRVDVAAWRSKNSPCGSGFVKPKTMDGQHRRHRGQTVPKRRP
jgi:hypothetical protein